MWTPRLKVIALALVLLGCAAAAGLALLRQRGKRPETKVESHLSSNPAEGKPILLERDGDPLPAGALARLGTMRLRHNNRTADAVLTPDSKIVIVSDWGGEIVLWDVASGKEVRRLPAADGPVNALALAICGDGKTLAAGGDGYFSLWEIITGKKLSQTRVSIGNIRQMLFTPDGKTLALHDDKRIVLWDVADNKQRHELKGLKGSVSRLDLSPDGTTLAAGGLKDGHIHLWDIATGQEKAGIQAHVVDVLYLAFSPDGKTLASAVTPSNGLCLWDVDSGKLVRRLSRSPGIFTFFPDGKTLAGLEGDGKLHIYDVDQGTLLRSYDLPGGDAKLSSGEGQRTARLVISPDGGTLAVLGGGTHTFDLVDAENGQLLHAFPGSRRGVLGLVFGADDKTIFSSPLNKFVLDWEKVPEGIMATFTGEDEAYSKALALSPDGKLLANNRDGVTLWDAATLKKVRRCNGPQEWIVSAVWSADGKTLASSSQKGTIRVWDPATGKQSRAIEASVRGLGEIALSPDAAVVAAGDYGRGVIHLWSAYTGKELRSITTSQRVISSLAYTPDGAYLVSGGSNGGICLSNPTTGRMLRRWETKPDATECLVISHDGRTVVTGHSDASVHLWEFATGNERACFRGHRGQVDAVAIARDGRHVASGSEDTTILVWDATGGARPDAALSPEQLQMLWHDLSDADAGRAYRALWQMALAPKPALPFLSERLRPAVPLDAARQKQVDQFLADLSSDRLAVRQQAEGELEKMGLIIEPVLLKTREGTTSAEVRRRIDSVLAKLATERLRTTRALEAIENMKTSEAGSLLKSIAGQTEPRP